jgi:hypothetical protein
MTGKGAIPFFLFIASEARQSVDRFVPRDDGERGGADFFSSLRAKRGNLWIALYLAVTVKSTGLVRASR